MSLSLNGRLEVSMHTDYDKQTAIIRLMNQYNNAQKTAYINYVENGNTVHNNAEEKELFLAMMTARRNCEDYNSSIADCVYGASVLVSTYERYNGDLKCEELDNVIAEMKQAISM